MGRLFTQTIYEWEKKIRSFSHLVHYVNLDIFFKIYLELCSHMKLSMNSIEPPDSKGNLLGMTKKDFITFSKCIEIMLEIGVLRYQIKV